MDGDLELLRGGGRDQDPRFGQDLEADRRDCPRVVLGAFLDPVVEELIGLGPPEESEAALMRDLAHWFAEQQAGLGRDGVDATATGLVREDREVLVG